MSTYYVAGVPYSSELYHHGIKGQKWGRRNYQNPDGSLTPAGRERYGVGKVREQLGFGSKGHLNAAQRAMMKSYKKDMKKFEKSETKINRKEAKGKDASKYIDRATGYLNSARATKTMAKTYSSLAKTEQKVINRGYRRVRHAAFRNSYASGGFAPFRDARLEANTYLTTELNKRRFNR